MSASSGDQREDQAATAAAVVAVVWVAATALILKALADAVRKAARTSFVAGVAQLRLRRQVAAIMAEARRHAEHIVAGQAEKAAEVAAAETVTDFPGRTPQAVSVPQVPPPVLFRHPTNPTRPRGTGTLPSDERRIANQAARSAVDDINRRMDPLTDRVFRDVDDAYRRAVEAVMDRRPGITDAQRLENAQKVLDDLARHGITGFIDRTGRRWELASYVEMATRTAISRQVTNLQLAAYQAEGVAAVLVIHRTLDAPCPLCRPYEGRVLAIGPGVDAGHQLTVTPWDSEPRTETVLATLEEALAAGLLHPSCRHSLVPWADGAAVTPADLEPKPPAVYEAEQRQRALERRARDADRVLQAAVTPQAKASAKRRLAAARSASREHAARHGVKRTPRREKAAGAR